MSPYVMLFALPVAVMCVLLLRAAHEAFGERAYWESAAMLLVVCLLCVAMYGLIV